MKKPNIETSAHGKMMAAVHDYQSGILIGNAIADWDAYRLWSEGPSDVCAARRCLSDDAMARLGVDPEDTIFLLEK